MASPVASLRALSLTVDERDVLEGAGVLGSLTHYLEQPLLGTAHVAFGITAERRAHGASEGAGLLEALTSDAAGAVALDALSERLPGPWFGGAAFDAREPASEDWKGFGAARWIVPRYLLSRGRGDPLRLTRFLTADEDADAARAELAKLVRQLDEAPHAPESAPPPARVVASGAEAYLRAVGAAVASIRAGGLIKVMVARALDVEANAPFDTLVLLRRLRARFPSCATFLFRGSEGTDFLGATPETLCQIHGARLDTEALAGTSAPAAAEALLTSTKDLHEHREVVEGIRTTLAPFVSSLEVPGVPVLKRLPNVAHLHTPIRGTLNPSLRMEALLGALHPTPSVGGNPRRAAMDFLMGTEGLRRGWYAGPVGSLGPKRAELFVALRCALVSGNRARIYVGAGIVEGSTPEGELEETSLKARVLLGALGL